MRCIRYAFNFPCAVVRDASGWIRQHGASKVASGTTESFTSNAPATSASQVKLTQTLTGWYWSICSIYQPDPQR